MAAFRQAVELGSDMLELDVQLTKVRLLLLPVNGPSIITKNFSDITVSHSRLPTEGISTGTPIK
jgi:Glycerophosphoryl diester phosphodiesterase family